MRFPSCVKWRKVRIEPRKILKIRVSPQQIQSRPVRTPLAPARMILARKQGMPARRKLPPAPARTLPWVTQNSFSSFRGHGRVVWYERMNALKETIIEKLDSLPEPTLRQVMDYLTLLARQGNGNEPSLLTVAGGLSGTPMSAAEIEQELYGQREAR
jgi:hypothetical protein